MYRLVLAVWPWRGVRWAAMMPKETPFGETSTELLLVPSVSIQGKKPIYIHSGFSSQWSYKHQKNSKATQSNTTLSPIISGLVGKLPPNERIFLSYYWRKDPTPFFTEPWSGWEEGYCLTKETNPVKAISTSWLPHDGPQCLAKKSDNFFATILGWYP